MVKCCMYDTRALIRNGYIYPQQSSNGDRITHMYSTAYKLITQCVCMAQSPHGEHAWLGGGRCVVVGYGVLRSLSWGGLEPPRLFLSPLVDWSRLANARSCSSCITGRRQFHTEEYHFEIWSRRKEGGEGEVFRGNRETVQKNEHASSQEELPTNYCCIHRHIRFHTGQHQVYTPALSFPLL